MQFNEGTKTLDLDSQRQRTACWQYPVLQELGMTSQDSISEVLAMGRVGKEVRWAALVCF